MTDQPVKHLFIVAGAGTYPACVVAGARAAGVPRISLLAIRGSTARASLAHTDASRWLGVGEVQKMFDWCAQLRPTHCMLIGGITPIALFRTRFDALSRNWLREMKIKNAHTIFGKIASEIQDRGVQMLPASCYMDNYIPGLGVLTQRAPDAREMQDITLGHKVAADICGLDIGQTLLVKEGMILAVEAFEGTDRAIKRGAKLGGKGAVVVKVAKDGHDMRFDIPVIGRKTIPVLRKAGISALAYQAGRLVMLEREEVVAAANRLNMAIVGLDSGLPQAPRRPT